MFRFLEQILPLLFDIAKKRDNHKYAIIPCFRRFCK